MTTPTERTIAVLRTEQFLLKLCDRIEMLGVPNTVREEAANLLRHYPTKLDMGHPQDKFDITLGEDEGEVVVPIPINLIKRVGWDLGDELVFEETLMCEEHGEFFGLSLTKKQDKVAEVVKKPIQVGKKPKRIKEQPVTEKPEEIKKEPVVDKVVKTEKQLKLLNKTQLGEYGRQFGIELDSKLTKAKLTDQLVKEAVLKPRKTEKQLKVLTKKQLEEYGREFGIEIDLKLTKAKLIDQLMTV